MSIFFIFIPCVIGFTPVNVGSPIQSSLHSRQRIYLTRPGEAASPEPLYYSTGSIEEYRPVISPRVQKIKDITLQKEILRDVTSSEFALQLEVKSSKEISKIDYEMLISKLEQHGEYLRKRNNTFDLELIARIMRTKQSLSELMEKQGIRSNLKNSGHDDMDDDSSKQVVKTSEEINLIVQQEQQKEDILKELQESLKLILREDGSVDWEGASAAGQEVAKFGTELWERLNGKEETEGFPSLSEILGQVPAKELVTEEIKRLSESKANARSAVDDSIATRDEMKATLRQERKDGLTITNEAVQSLKLADVRVKELDKRLKLFSLDLDIERICVYLQQELESTLEPSDQRVFIAEVGLIEKQLQVLISGLKLGFDTSKLNMDLVSLVDDDELALLYREVDDLKTRLGIDAEAQKVDWGTLGVLGSESIAKLKEGLSFYGEGTKILFNDLGYARMLLFKAVKGTTLKPREVNAVRRTGKDLLTLIPTTIILIIPLSPVGHVLVFSFIQRFFPDFFPSCYTEKRLNLRRLYAEIERKNNDDLLGIEEVKQEWFTAATVQNGLENIQQFFSPSDEKKAL